MSSSFELIVAEIDYEIVRIPFVKYKLQIIKEVFLVHELVHKHK